MSEMSVLDFFNHGGKYGSALVSKPLVVSGHVPELKAWTPGEQEGQLPWAQMSKGVKNRRRVLHPFYGMY